MMIILTILAVSVFAIALMIISGKVDSSQEIFILNFIYYAVLFASAIILASEFSGSSWNPLLQIAAFTYIALFWVWRILSSGFWALVFYQACLMIHLFVGAYLYSASQMPYQDEPFSHLSDNQPHELKAENFPHHWISALPVAPKAQLTTVASHPQQEFVQTVSKQKRDHEQALQWSELSILMKMDSQIRNRLQQLKEQQDRELSDMLAQLNSLSVANTQMRRRALKNSQVDNLLRERAISTARHRTLIETWRLLDRDERAFRKRQAEHRFHALFELLKDDKVDESHKRSLIDYMVRHFADDVRLIKPLIKLYHQLDHDYPRQKRLNQVFLDLYIARRQAILQGFSEIGEAALQPLLDYRHRTISEVSYSQARLDKFIAQRYGVTVANLYTVAAPQSVPDFLNRRKYPILEKLTGASFKQDYIRRDLMQTIANNNPNRHGEPVMGISVTDYQQIRQTVDAGYDDSLDYLLIHPDPVVRGNLAWSLAERKDPALIPLVFELMRDAHPEVRRLAAIASGNFHIQDSQGANDPKFIELVSMLQNYRSNSDAFGRAWALLALSNIADKQKVLFVIDLILNDGSGYHSSMGAASPTWRSEREQHAINSLIKTLEKTPEELLVKTYALHALIAINSPESLGILLHYLHHIYAVHDSRPSMWRYFMPHISLPQEAENVEDVIVYLAQQSQSSENYAHNRHLKALNEFLRKSYEAELSGEFFQLLRFLQLYDEAEYSRYQEQNPEQIRIMRIHEYVYASYIFWLISWPVCLALTLIIIYGVLPMLKLSTPKGAQLPNARSNPAADSRHQRTAPAASIVPVKIIKQQ